MTRVIWRRGGPSLPLTNPTLFCISWSCYHQLVEYIRAQRLDFIVKSLRMRPNLSNVKYVFPGGHLPLSGVWSGAEKSSKPLRISKLTYSWAFIDCASKSSVLCQQHCSFLAKLCSLFFLIMLLFFNGALQKPWQISPKIHFI